MRKSFYLISILCLFVWSCSSSGDEPAPNNNNNNNNNGNNGNSTEVLGCTDPNSSSYNPDANADDGSCAYGIESAVSDNPRSFTTKVLIEQMTGTWCGWCVDGSLRMKSLIDDNDGKVIGTTIHEGDAMENTSIFNYMNNTFGSFGFPAGMVNRYASTLSGDVVMGRTEWEANVSSRLEASANMGVALDVKLSGNELTVLAHVGVNQAETANYSLVVYLLEDELVYPQNNYYSSTFQGGVPGHPYYNLPHPVTNYVHNHVLREGFTPMTGVELPDYAKVAGGTFTRVYTTDISSYNADNLKVVAFVENKSSNNIINVQAIDVPADGVTVTQDFD